KTLACGILVTHLTLRRFVAAGDSSSTGAWGNSEPTFWNYRGSAVCYGCHGGWARVADPHGSESGISASSGIGESGKRPDSRGSGVAQREEHASGRELREGAATVRTHSGRSK